MDKKEQTMRLSEDPRFIKHVKQILADYRRRYNLAVDIAEERHVRLKRSAFERLKEMELTKPGAFAREYEACLAKRSDLPGTLRMFVSSLGSQALRNFAGELAKEKEEGKDGQDL